MGGLFGERADVSFAGYKSIFFNRTGVERADGAGGESLGAELVGGAGR